MNDDMKRAKMPVRPRFFARAVRSRVRHQPGVMNKTEAAYSKHLDVLKAAGDVLWWAFEGVKLKLADKTYYTPDFMVIRAAGCEVEFHDVKGWRSEDDARVKIKVASRLFPFRFAEVRSDKREWVVEWVGGKEEPE